ncbi:hypothetical protein AYO21_08046 [Fonsecaea monophora]|uniref:Uncharacterized protein n=1 Tax=Fonsecaea monophora TaxID=254056 RepID=A0A177F0J0_9EURO|nr:hypothetical protein AYO21_08046 [Fonsecaea monophora]OAG37803.1 hypothetical protein AYO21_08046 [Fonsecaea monophora]
MKVRLVAGRAEVAARKAGKRVLGAVDSAEQVMKETLRFLHRRIGGPQGRSGGARMPVVCWPYLHLGVMVVRSHWLLNPGVTGAQRNPLAGMQTIVGVLFQPPAKMRYACHQLLPVLLPLRLGPFLRGHIGSERLSIPVKGVKTRFEDCILLNTGATNGNGRVIVATVSEKLY